MAFSCSGARQHLGNLSQPKVRLQPCISVRHCAAAVRISTDGRGIEFTSDDGLVKLKVLADYNDQNVSLGEYRAAIVREFTESNQLEYEPMGRSWFVLSGVRGESIYYQKVLFACGGRIINAFALTYPAQLRREFDAIVTMIEKNFHPTAGTACAVKIG